MSYNSLMLQLLDFYINNFLKFTYEVYNILVYCQYLLLLDRYDHIYKSSWDITETITNMVCYSLKQNDIDLKDLKDSTSYIHLFEDKFNLNKNNTIYSPTLLKDYIKLISDEKNLENLENQYNIISETNSKINDVDLTDFGMHDGYPEATIIGEVYFYIRENHSSTLKILEDIYHIKNVYDFYNYYINNSDDIFYNLFTSIKNITCAIHSSKWELTKFFQNVNSSIDLTKYIDNNFVGD